MGAGDRFLSVRSVHIFPMFAWVFSRLSGFLQCPKDVHVRLTGVSKLSQSECVCVWAFQWEGGLFRAQRTEMLG